ncbi:hypothetical protein CYMTET_34412, partial [Cymbomonas tetramitiformis]
MAFFKEVRMYAVTLLVFGGTLFIHGYLLIGLLYNLLPFWVWAPATSIYFLDILFGGAQHTRKYEWSAFINSFVTAAPVEYFNMKLLMDPSITLQRDQQYLFSLHPHGILPYGGLFFYALGSPLREKFPWLKVHPCGATVVFM